MILFSVFVLCKVLAFPEEGKKIFSEEELWTAADLPIVTTFNSPDIVFHCKLRKDGFWIV